MKRFSITIHKQKDPRGLSPQANYTDRPTDRSLSAKLVPTFSDRGCRVVSATDPHGRILGFLERSRYYFFLSCIHEAEWTTFQTNYFSENLVAPGIEPGTSGSVARNSDHQTTDSVSITIHKHKKASHPCTGHGVP
jgi:hypothetical protein